MRTLLSLSLLLGAVGCAAGCAGVDPLHRPGTWQPVGANDANLRAMIANPEDLHHGRAGSGADGEIAARAVARYRAGKVKELPDSGIAQIAPVSSGSAAAPATVSAY